MNDSNKMQISQLNIPSTLEAVEQFQTFIQDAVYSYEQYKDRLSVILYAVNEAINNAMKHGNSYDENKFVRIMVAISPDQLQVSVEDEGDGFDPTVVPDPTLPENIENVDGRGLFIIQKLSDNLEFALGGRKLIVTFLP